MISDDLNDFLVNAKEYLDYAYRDGPEGAYDRNLVLWNLDQNIDEIWHALREQDERR